MVKRTAVVTCARYNLGLKALKGLKGLKGSKGLKVRDRSGSGPDQYEFRQFL